MRLVLILCLAGIAASGRAATPVAILEIDGAISPATSDYIERGFAKALQQQSELIIIKMDTPGGLDNAMRDIVQTILGSPVPVVTYVAPPGARAASAGTYILYASHIAVMAPGTNVGAATPVSIGGRGNLPGPDVPGNADSGEKKPNESDGEQGDQAMNHKIVNDAVAYLRSLAQLRGRNEAWAEQAVRDAASIAAGEALQLGVIDLIADNIDQLLIKLDGREVTIEQRTHTLATREAQVITIAPDWRTRLLAVIADPNIAYILILVGIYGLIFEFYNPGFMLPGVIGAISLMLALFALQVLPVNYAGLGLLFLGVAFMVAEAFAPSFGILGIGGLTAFLIGSIILIDTDMPGYGVSLPLIIGFSATSALFFFGIVGMAVKARQRPVVSGQEELLGAVGIAKQAFEDRGYVQIHGESWQASSPQPVAVGQRVRVVRLDGLTLIVEPLKEN